MIKLTKRSIGVAFLILSGLFVAVLFYDGDSDTGTRDAPAGSAARGFRGSPSDWEEQNKINSIRSKIRNSEDSDSEVSLEDLKKRMEIFFQEQEARRCRTLAEYDHDGANIYIVAVDPPDIETIKWTRKMIASLAESCKKGDLQAFDDHVQNLISTYDPFGTLGKKAFYISISENSGKQEMSGFVFPVDTFDGLSRSLDPNSGERFVMKHAKGYLNSDSGTLHRFRAIIR